MLFDTAGGRRLSMLHLPLLSDAYVAALVEADGPPPQAPIETPCERPDDADDEAAEATASENVTPDDEDDMETARTRPLRLDQIHL
jgi:hypothetical protein